MIWRCSVTSHPCGSCDHMNLPIRTSSDPEYIKCIQSDNLNGQSEEIYCESTNIGDECAASCQNPENDILAVQIPEFNSVVKEIHLKVYNDVNSVFATTVSIRDENNNEICTCAPKQPSANKVEVENWLNNYWSSETYAELVFGCDGDVQRDSIRDLDENTLRSIWITYGAADSVAEMFDCKAFGYNVRDVVGEEQ